MDKIEAREILERKMQELRTCPYSQLLIWIRERKVEVHEVKGKSGAEYQIELEVVWDGQPEGNIMVIGSIDDGRWPAGFFPLTESFILSPGGSFVGE